MLTLLGLRNVIGDDRDSWRLALFTVAMQNRQHGILVGHTSMQAWVDSQYRHLLEDVQSGIEIGDSQHCQSNILSILTRI